MAKKKKKIRPEALTPAAVVTFADVQTILNTALTNWTAAHGRPPDLSGHDPSDPSLPTFAHAWDTEANLRAAVGHGKRLIQPEVIGNGKGDQANLVIDLKTGMPQRMPKGGPFVSDPDIQKIVDWINSLQPA